MATRSQIQNLIDTNLADESDIHAVEHREVENAFLGQLYDAPILDRSGFPPVLLQPVQANLVYNIRTKKMGNMVFMSGYVYRSSGGSIPSGVNLFEILNSEYYPVGDTRITGSRQHPSTDEDVPSVIGVIANVPMIINFTPLPATVLMLATYFNGFYYVNP